MSVEPGGVSRSGPSAWNLPNGLTVLRVLLVPVFGWLLLTQDGTDALMRWAALGVFAVAMVTDSVDGDLARRRGLITDFGKVADPIADKLLIGTALVGLSVLGELWWWVTVVILVREVGVTVLRFAVIRRGIMPASRGGKLKTALQTLALVLLIAPLAQLPGGSLWVLVAQAVLAAALIVTVATGIDYVVKARALGRIAATRTDGGAPGGRR